MVVVAADLATIVMAAGDCGRGDDWFGIAVVVVTGISEAADAGETDGAATTIFAVKVV